MSSSNHHILLEHSFKEIEKIENVKLFRRKFKTDRGQDYYVFEQKETETHFQLSANYFIGVDWLVKEKHSIQVEPKINSKLAKHYINLAEKEDNENSSSEIEKEENEAENEAKDENNLIELDYLTMLLKVMSNPKVAKKTTDLVHIYWDEPQISVTQKQDQLTPFLVVQFLQLLKTIVRKGLKKSYYKKQENFRNRVKGKILVGQHIKQNVFKNRLTQTFCEYQEFGVDSIENRFLKKVWRFCLAYVEENKDLFKRNNTEIQNILNYARPAFEQIGDDIEEYQLKHIKHNPFFKEYKEAITIGKYILKKFAYNISKTKETEEIFTPPFWIDMPFLFELYFYAKLLKSNPELNDNIHFQFSTYGNALDFLISDENNPMIIDTKYKLHYKWGQIHEDIRQVSGYARLHKVRNKLNFHDDKIIDCLIVYPDMSSEFDDDLSMINIKHENRKSE